MRSRRRAAVEERLFRDFVESVKVRAMFLLDAEGHVVSWNAGASAVHGYATAAIVGRPFSVFYPPEAVAARIPAQQLAAAREAQSVEDEGWRLREDGSRFWANVVITALRSGDGELSGFGVTVGDLTGRYRSSQFFQSVLDHTADAFIGIDARGFILSFNRAAERMFGYTEADALGLSVDLMVTGALHYARDGVGREVAGRRRDGTPLPIDFTLTPFQLHDQSYVMCVCRDLTERKRDEERLRHAQQMQAMGQLASGVAHDFNNLLTVVAGYCETFRESLAAGDTRQEALQQITVAAEKAASLTQQLLAFGRQRPCEPRVIDLHEAIAETTRLLQRTLSENIVLTTSLAARSSHVRIDEGYVGQILLNLAVNARDAMPQGGDLTVVTSDVVLGADAARGGVAPGLYVRLRVGDTGCGMPADVRARAFEPFYTTKAAGRGTGLGLATVYRIVQESGGQIAIDSTPGLGTTVTIDLPAVSAVRTREAGPVRHTIAVGTLRGLSVLLVEDEPQVRDSVAAMLATLGFRALTAGSAAEAIEQATAPGEHVDLLITDVIMPGLNGPQLASQLCAFQPRLKVLFMSGYAEDVIAGGDTPAVDVAFLQKPFTTKSLGRKLEELFGRSGIS